MSNSDPSKTLHLPQEDPPEDDSAQDNITKIFDDETVSDGTNTIEAENPAPKTKMGKVKKGILGVIAILSVLAVSALLGLQSGRIIKSDTTAILQMVEAVKQYELGLRDMESGQCQFARQRFEAVITYDPEYPGVAQKWADAQVCIDTTGTPTTAPTATLTSTPDVRGPDALFSDAQNLMIAEDWGQLLEVLDSLRKNNPEYQPVKVDGLYFLALRNRGEQRILAEGLLEGGIFDMTRAEQFGPLDAQGDAYRLWAGLYLSGLSYWEIDWEQVIFYFEQVVPLAPNMWDRSYFAVDRLATASVYYSQELVELGDFYLAARGWCDANKAFLDAEDYYPLSAEIQVTAEYAAYRCELNPEATPRAQP